MMRPLLLLISVAAATPVTGAGQQPPPARAATLLHTFLRTHPELAALEIAVDSAGHCRTVAASDPKDVGEACDDDELGPMRTGQADIEAPSRSDPVYDITQALHDASGHLIGAVGMDIPPAGHDRATVVALAARLLRELEAQIPSKASLLQPSVQQP